jgi:hypothetical protein
MNELLDAFLDLVRNEYANDIALVHVHGSTIYGNAHHLSDLDIFFVSKTERGHKLASTFILKGIGCDLWDIGWKRLENIAEHNENHVGLLLEGEIPYYNTEEDLLRFKQLGERAKELYADKDFSIRHCEALMSKMYEIYYKVHKSKDIIEIRYEVIAFLYQLSFILSELNGIFIKKGRRYLKEELLAMPIIPKSLETVYDTLFTNNDIKIIKDNLIILIEELDEIISTKKKEWIKHNSFSEEFNGWYEEMVQHYNKIHRANEVGDIYTPLFASVEYCYELDNMLYNTGTDVNLPDMVEAYDSNKINKISAVAEKHQKAFERLLDEKRVKVKKFNSIDEVKRFWEQA